MRVGSVWLRAAVAAAGGNASEAREPTKVEVAKRIENWFGAGEQHGGVARRGNGGVACQRTKWGTIRFAGGPVGASLAATSDGLQL